MSACGLSMASGNWPISGKRSPLAPFAQDGAWATWSSMQSTK